MTERRSRERGQATVEYVGVLVLVLMLILAVTSVTVRSLHPSASPPDLVGRIADRLTAPLAGGTPAPAAPDMGGAVVPRPAGAPLEPFWIGMDLHHHEAPIGRWVGAAVDAVADRLPDMAKGCVSGVLGLNELRTPSGGRPRGEMGLGKLGGRAVGLLLKRTILTGCATGAAGALLPSDEG